MTACRGGVGLLLCSVLVVAPAALRAQLPAINHQPPALGGALAFAPEANLFLGGASSSVPIEVPPGRNGMTPQLGLAYSSGGGPSLYGYGWDLTLGRIQRRLKHGQLTCADLREQNEFVLLLPGRTVEFRLDPATGEGQAHVEELFLRIRHHAENRWEVWEPNGRLYEFGIDAGARSGSHLADRFHSTSCAGDELVFGMHYTFAWELSRVRDPNGNTIEFAYSNEDQLARPQRIDYGGNAAAGLPHAFSVVFDWAARPADDRTEDGLGGFRRRLAHRLRAIKIYALGTVLRSYGLTYDGEAGIARRRGRQSFLSAVTQYAGDLDAGGTALASVGGTPAASLFAYHQEENFGLSTDRQLRLPQGLSQHTSARLYSNDAERNTLRDIFDINGDGFPDLVDTLPLNGGSATNCGGGLAYWNVYLGSEQGFAQEALQWSVLGDVMCVIQRERVNGNERWTERATRDFTGDGVADFIDTSGSIWYLYKGFATPSGGGFDLTGDAIPGGAGPLARRLGGVDLPGHAQGTIETRALIDVNGDGRPDLVEAPGPNAPDGRWTVWLNLRRDVFDYDFYSLAPPRRFRTQFSVISHEVGGNVVIRSLDLNGDGLLDQVEASPMFWKVFLNDGKSITSRIDWPVAQIGGRWALAHVEPASGNTVRELIDMNGDGLPDLVDTHGCGSSNPYWQVMLNRGSGFAQEIRLWGSGSGARCAIVNRGTHQTHGELLDIDGDGLVDFVSFTSTSVDIVRNSGGAWCSGTLFPPACGSGFSALPRPEGMRPDLLVAIENGVGALTALAYRPLGQWYVDAPPQRLPVNLWTLTHIRSDDGLCHADLCAGNGAHTVERTLRYAGAQFAVDSREFLGFRRVWVEDLSAATRAAQTHTPTQWRGIEVVFHQAGARRGRLAELTEWSVEDDGAGGAVWSAPLVRTQHTWQCFDLSTELLDPFCSGHVRTWLRLATTLTSHLSPDEPPRQRLLANLAWHRCPNGRFYGNVAHQISGAPAGGSRLHTHTEYACSADTATAYITDRPIRRWQSNRSDSVKLREQWFFYDAQPYGVLNRGNPTRTESWLDQVTASLTNPCTAAPAQRCIRTDSEYDTAGNVTATLDPLRSRIEITYDPETRIYPYITTAVQFQHRVATRFDPGCATLVWQSVPYTGNADPEAASVAKEQHRYDAFCRLSATALADQDVDASPSNSRGPNETFKYVLGTAGRPTQVIVRRRQWRMEPEVLWYDGLGRLVARAWPTVVNGRRIGVRQATEYDVRGHLRAGSVPITGTSYFFPTDVPKSLAEHDALGRPVAITHPDGSRRHLDHSLTWQTTTFDECYVQPTAACPGSKTVESRDVFGNVVERQLYQRDTLMTRTRFTYDDLGQLITTEQGDGGGWKPATQIHIDYDSLGRKVFMHDPDSGAWLYGYDAGGNLAYQDDPQPNQHVLFCHDRMSRLTRECRIRANFAAPLGCLALCDEEVRYTYDEPQVPFATGRLTRVEDPSGETRFDEYDTRGRLISMHKRIEAGGQSAEGVIAFTYDTAGRLLFLRYPDGERLKYSYDTVGQITGMRGVKRYVSKIAYDLFGRPITLEHADRSTDLWRYYDHTQNFRLAAIETTRRRQPLLHYAYSEYAANGLLARLDDRSALAPALDHSAAFTYDGLGRLKGASGPNLPYAAGANGYDYDGLGNLTRKEGSSLAYSALRPHTLTAVGGSAAGLVHDDNGNRRGKAGHSYQYDLSDQLTRISVGSTVVADYVYDYTGERVAKISSGRVTFYFGGLMEVSGSRIVKHYFAGARRVASTRIDPAGPKPVRVITHYHLDHLGSVHLLTSKKGVVAHIRYRPFGEVRGYFDQYGGPVGPESSSCVGPSCYEFTDYEIEPASGLSYAGARFYDPKLASFLSHDPLRQFASPYNYAGWNPVNFTDPGGLFADLPPIRAHSSLPAESVYCHFAYCGPNLGPSFGVFGGRVTETRTVEIPNDLRDCVGDRCRIILSGTNHGSGTHNAPSGPDVADIATTAADIAASIFVPVYGEISDLAIILDPGSSDWERGLAQISFIAGALTGGLSPNAGSVLRSLRGSGRVAREISTPYGLAVQASSAEARAALRQVRGGATVYKGGILGRSQTGSSQFLSLENPLTPGFARRHGVPPQNANFDFVLTGRVQPRAPVITRHAPGISPNSGGGVEVVTTSGSFRIDSFYMP